MTENRKGMDIYQDLDLPSFPSIYTSIHDFGTFAEIDCCRWETITKQEYAMLYLDIA